MLFGFKAYRPPMKLYRRWVDALFASADPPCLREPVYLWIAPWWEGARGPSGLRGSLPAVEKEVIALASVQFGLVFRMQRDPSWSEDAPTPSPSAR